MADTRRWRDGCRTAPLHKASTRGMGWKEEQSSPLNNLPSLGLSRTAQAHTTRRTSLSFITGARTCLHGTWQWGSGSGKGEMIVP